MDNLIKKYKIKKNTGLFGAVLTGIIFCIIAQSCSKTDGATHVKDSKPPKETKTFSRDSNFITLNNNVVVEGYLSLSKWYAYSYKDINYKNLTHIVYAFLRPTSATDATLTTGDTAYERAAYSLYPDLVHKTFLDYGDQLIARAHANNVKVLIGIAGGNGKSARDLAGVFSNDSLRADFVSNLVNLCAVHGCDGVDLDYEYPTSASDGAGVLNFAQDLRIAFLQSDTLSKKDMLITMACPVGNWSGEYYDYTKLAKCVNWFSPMTYSFSSKSAASFNAPLYNNAALKISTAVSTSVDYFKNTRGIDPRQIVIGVPFFGWVYNGYTALNAPATRIDKAYKDLYNTYIQGAPGNGFVSQWDDVSKQTYLVNTTTGIMLTYDNEAALSAKCSYIKTNGLKGAMIWELSRGFIAGATDQNPLLTTLGNGLLKE